MANEAATDPTFEEFPTGVIVSLHAILFWYVGENVLPGIIGAPV